ncbi:WD-40 repeat protein [Kalymmatonema gypsitolerans NIES-4073]|nr:WD-40 repeat protein [Scytonema sp. NIES-4073]
MSKVPLSQEFFFPFPCYPAPASSGMDTTVKLWSREGQLITTLLGHSGSVWNLAIAYLLRRRFANAERVLCTQRCCKAQNAPDGSFLASVGEDNTLVVWNLPRILKLDLLEYGCNWVRDYLRTSKEVEEGKF